MRKMIKLVCSTLVLTAVFGMFFGNALASDNCKAGCQLSYKNCMKNADGDIDRSLNCSDAKDECIERCNNN